MARDPVIKATIRAKDDASGSIDKVQGRFKRFGDFLKSRFVVTLGDVQRALTAVFRAIEETGTLESQTQALRANLAAQNQSFDEYLAKLQEVSQNQISTADLIASSNQALLLGIPAEQIADLLEIASSRAVATGQNIGQAFDNIVTGVGRASPLILDNLGIVVKLEDAYSAYAAEIGKTAGELSKYEQTQALVNEITRTSAGSTQALLEVQSELQKQLSQGTAAAENFRATLSQFGAALGLRLAAVVTDAALRLSFLAEGFIKLGRVIADVGSQLPFVGDRFKGLADAARDADDRIDGFQERLTAMRDKLNEGAGATFRLAAGFAEVDDRATKAGGAIRGATEAAQQQAVATAASAASIEELALAEDRLETIATGTNRVFGDQVVQLEAIARAVRITATEFARLEQTQGRAAAIAAAQGSIDQSGTITGRTRIFGGSRLNRPAGLQSANPIGRNSSTLSGGTFTL